MDCGHAGPYSLASNDGVSSEYFATGGLNLKFPTGGSANGIPKNFLRAPNV